MANIQNLKRGNPATQFKAGDRRAAEMGAKGGRKTAENKEKAKTFRSEAQKVLEMPLKEGALMTLEDVENFAEANKLNISVGTKIVLTAALQASQGDQRAREWLAEITGQKPAENIDLNVSTKLDISDMDIDARIALIRATAEGLEAGDGGDGGGK